MFGGVLKRLLYPPRLDALIPQGKETAPARGLGRAEAALHRSMCRGRPGTLLMWVSDLPSPLTSV
jgi:hypothetical protein